MDRDSSTSECLTIENIEKKVSVLKLKSNEKKIKFNEKR